MAAEHPRLTIDTASATVTVEYPDGARTYPFDSPEAFRHLSERTDVEELNSFTLAMIQADVFGVSIASVLRTQAQQLRIKRRQRAEAKAQQTPVKIVFPLILCILPALFVVIVGPGVIRIVESLFKS